MGVSALELRRRVLMAQPHKERKTGGIVSFKTHVPQVLGVSVPLSPVQAGTGDPYPPGGGKNKYPPCEISGTMSDMTVSTSGDTYLLSGTPSAYAQVISSDSFILPAGIYKLSVFSNATSSKIQGQLRSADGKTIYAQIGIGGSISFTLESETTVKPRITVSADTGSTNGITIRMMVSEDSTTPTAYAPYSNIRPITGWTGATAYRTGKNLLNVDNWEVDEGSKIVIESGKMTVTNSAYQENKNKYILPSTNQMTLSFHVKTIALNDARASFKLYADGVAIIPTQGASTSGNIALDSVGHEVDVVANFTGKHYISIGGWAWGGTVEISNIQLELNPAASPFAQYSGESFPFTFPDTVYGGRLEPAAGRVVVDRAKETFADSANWWLTTGTNEGNQYYQFNRTRPAMLNSRGLLCNLFALMEIRYRGAKTGIIAYSDNIIRVAFTESDNVKTLQDFGTFASNNPIEVVYFLAEPIIIPLTPAEIRALMGENNVFADTGDVDVEFWTN